MIKIAPLYFVVAAIPLLYTVENHIAKTAYSQDTFEKQIYSVEATPYDLNRSRGY